MSIKWLAMFSCNRSELWYRGKTVHLGSGVKNSNLVFLYKLSDLRQFLKHPSLISSLMK